MIERSRASASRGAHSPCRTIQLGSIAAPAALGPANGTSHRLRRTDRSLSNTFVGRRSPGPDCSRSTENRAKQTQKMPPGCWRSNPNRHGQPTGATAVRRKAHASALSIMPEVGCLRKAKSSCHAPKSGGGLQERLGKAEKSANSISANRMPWLPTATVKKPILLAR